MYKTISSLHQICASPLCSISWNSFQNGLLLERSWSPEASLAAQLSPANSKEK